MKRWRKVSVGPFVFTVYLATKEEAPELADNDGLCLCDKQIIYVNSQLPKEQRENTLLHELQHAYFFAGGIGEYLGSLVGAEKVDAVEEALVSLQTPYLFQTLVAAGWKPPKI